MSQFQDGKPPDRPPMTGNEWGILLIISFFFVLLIGIEIATDFTVKKLSIPFFLFSWAILLVIHELGHALMARFLGWRVELISIGIGKLRCIVTIWDMPIEFRTIPISGFVQPCPNDLIYPQLKDFLIYAAGPGIELVFVGIAIWFVGYDNLLTPSESIGMIAVQSFCVAAMFGVIVNLLPFPHETERGTAWSDGLGMIMCWRLPTSAFAEQIER